MATAQEAGMIASSLAAIAVEARAVFARLRSSKTFYASILAIGGALHEWLDGHWSLHEALMASVSAVAIMGLRDALARFAPGSTTDLTQFVAHFAVSSPDDLPAPILDALKAHGIDPAQMQSVFRHAIGLQAPVSPPPPAAPPPG